MSAMSELIAVQRRRKKKLDDQSIPLLAHLRENGVFTNSDWRKIKSAMDEALSELASVARAKRNQKNGIIDVDGDSRNADWIKLVGVFKRTGHKLPGWAALWLHRLYLDQGVRYWRRVGRLASELNVPELKK